MEGSYKKESHWYRCRFEANRGGAAADAAGHPRALSIEEDAIIEALADSMGRRLFGPDRLRVLRLDRSRAVVSSWDEHDRELGRLKREREDSNAHFAVRPCARPELASDTSVTALRARLPPCFRRSLRCRFHGKGGRLLAAGLGSPASSIRK
jgi:hypothetical protein